MAVPDISGLTEEELVTLLQQANSALQSKMQTEDEVRRTLLNPDTVQKQIDNLLTQKDNIQAVLDTPNSEVNSSPAKHVMSLARAQKRTINNLIRVLKTSAGVLESADLGEDEEPEPTP